MKKARRKIVPPKVPVHDSKEVAKFRDFLRLVAMKVDRADAYRQVYRTEP